MNTIQWQSAIRRVRNAGEAAIGAVAAGLGNRRVNPARPTAGCGGDPGMLLMNGTNSNGFFATLSSRSAGCLDRRASVPLTATTETLKMAKRAPHPGPPRKTQDDGTRTSPRPAPHRLRRLRRRGEGSWRTATTFPACWPDRASAGSGVQCANQGQGRNRRGFTLIELLVVISIMALLASFTIAVIHGVAINKYRSTARAEMHEIMAALDNYKAQYGVYPPGNANPPGTYGTYPTNSMYPPLYYELVGVTNKGTVYATLDGQAEIPVSQVPTAFGVGGFVNCSKGSGDDAVPARNFLPGLKANRIGSVNDNGVAITNLVTSVLGPDTGYRPLGVQDVNPFRYLYPGVNNPSGYDLWVELVISGKTNLICNWNTATLLNSGVP